MSHHSRGLPYPGKPTSILFPHPDPCPYPGLSFPNKAVPTPRSHTYQSSSPLPHPGSQVTCPPTPLLNCPNPLHCPLSSSPHHSQPRPLQGRVPVPQSSAFFPLSHWLLLPVGAGGGRATGERPAPCLWSRRRVWPQSDPAPFGRDHACWLSGAGRRCLGSSGLGWQVLWGWATGMTAAGVAAAAARG